MGGSGSATGEPGCPKRMVYGPCGGVRFDGGCEMRPGPCVFPALVPWPGGPLGPVDGRADRPTSAAAVDLRSPMRPPLVLTDLSVPPADAATLSSIAGTLAPTCDALLVGDHQDRADFAPSLLARLIRDAGGVPWVTLTCRDRTRVVLEQELRSLRHDGEVTVLCVTGDGRTVDAPAGSTSVFDLDGTRLAALAVAVGVRVAVAETPQAPPTALRPARLVQKQRAGATVAVLNSVDSVDGVARFMAAAVCAGLDIPVIASVPVYTDARSAQVLTALPGLEVNGEAIRSVLDAVDPVAAGIERATVLARALLAIDGVAGVNLSGMASARSPAFAASVQAEIGRAIRGEVRNG